MDSTARSLEMRKMTVNIEAADRITPLVEMREIVKRFPGVLANNGINLEVRRGEVHALLGENGAGKTTLMNILSGLYQPDNGEIRVEGELKSFRSTRDAIQAGIGMVHQHFSLVDVFTVAENVIIGLDRPRLKLNTSEVEEVLLEMGQKYGLQVDPRAKIWQLSVGEQQRVEILKMLYRDAQLLILDEPTAVLAPQEAKELAKTLRQMVSTGRSVLYISHKLREVLEVADRITVLNSGQNVATIPASDIDEKQLTQLMVGGVPVQISEKARESQPQRVILDIADLWVRGDRGNQALQGFTLQIREGEILGLAGIAGNGQRELAEAIVGLRDVQSGKICMESQEITNQAPQRLIQAGLSLIPENRMEMGLISELGLYDNAILKNYRQPPISRGQFLDTGQIRAYAEKLVQEFSIRVADLNEPVWKLSGGNLQRLLLGREISAKPRILVAANPTRGLDIQAAMEIRRMLLEQRGEGASILLISEDLDELLSISDRIAVIYGGQIIGAMDCAEANIEELGLLMMGTAVREVK
jgi:general nucleoside transport system ATP-binding protein